MASVNDSDVRIVLLGKTGAGKSATGNTILRNKTFTVDCSFQPTTRESRKYRKGEEERTMYVIDTPGLFDTRAYKNVMKLDLEKALDLAHPGPHVFLLVMKLDVFTEKEKKTMEWIAENFGEEVRKYIIVLFTHGNVLNQNRKRKTVEEYLQERPDMKNLLNSVAGYHVFENEDDDKVQVTELLEKIDKLKERNDWKFYTKDIYDKIQSSKKAPELQEKNSAGIGAVAGAAGGTAVAALVGFVLVKARAVKAEAAVGGVALAAAAVAAAAAWYYMKQQTEEKERKEKE